MLRPCNWLPAEPQTGFLHEPPNAQRDSVASQNSPLLYKYFKTVVLRDRRHPRICKFFPCHLVSLGPQRATFHGLLLSLVPSRTALSGLPRNDVEKYRRAMSPKGCDKRCGLEIDGLEIGAGNRELGTGTANREVGTGNMELGWGSGVGAV